LVKQFYSVAELKLVKMFNITILVGKKLLDASLYFFLPSSANQ